MAIITNYTTLQSELKDELNRSNDTSSPWTRFIDDAESELKTDPRVRTLMQTTLVADAEEVNLPSGFVSLESLVHDGATYFDQIEIVPLAMLPEIKAITDTTSGPPTSAAVIGNSTIRFAPVPDQTYNLDMTYWATISSLGGSVQSNWLLDSHPDIYLAACVIEAAKYFRNPELLTAQRAELELKLEKLHRDKSRQQFGGTLTRKPLNPIG